MSKANEPHWKLEEYNHVTQRDKTDGEIFWNKINVLIAVNFGLFGFFSLKDFSHSEISNTNLWILKVTMLSGLIFSLFWLLVLCRQSEWIRHWKNTLLEMEKVEDFKLSVQTHGNSFGEKMCCILKLGSYHRVGWILPMAFAALWTFALVRFWNG